MLETRRLAAAPRYRQRTGMSTGVPRVGLQSAVFDGRQIPPVHNATRLLEKARTVLEAARRAG